MRRFLIALFALCAAVLPTGAFADFVAFDKAKFEQTVKSGSPVIVHTHEWWCPTCIQQSRVLDRLQKEPKYAKVVIFRASIGNDRETLAPFKVNSRSIVLGFAGGKPVGRVDFGTDEVQIRALLDRAIAAGG